MIKPLRFSSLVWLAVLGSAAGLLCWMNVVRVRHVERVTALGGGSDHPPVVSPESRPELTPGNGLIVPGQLAESFHWLAQTEQMFNRGEWRVRHIDYENAPFGRAVYATSPYRWWLGSIAWGEHLISGRPPAREVERAALVADPLLHLLLLLGFTLFVAWRFGALPAVLVALGCVTVFPLAGGYLPGAPDDRGLAQILALAGVLLLVAGVGAAEDGKSARRWFVLAGVMGGLGLWVSVAVEIPVLGGIVAGALLAAWIARRPPPGKPAGNGALPWRAWALAGAVTTLGAYLVEFAPAHLGDIELAVIHPLYGLAWLGAGELLAEATAWIRGEEKSGTRRVFVSSVLALAAVAALPVAIWKVGGSAFLLEEATSFRLTNLPGGAVAQSFLAWIVHDGLTPAAMATLLPLALVVPLAWSFWRRQTGRTCRVAMAIALGPALVALGLACRHLVWWNTLDGLLLVLLVAAAAGWPESPDASERLPRLAWTGVVLLVLLPGVLQVAPPAGTETDDHLDRTDVVGLIDRDLAKWISLHGPPGGAVLLAPPNETTALCYYGDLRGLGSLSRENKSGVAAAVLILGNQDLQEAKALIDRRTITHIVLLSWDSGFDAYTRAGPGQNTATLRDKLQLPTLPPWLRPLAYSLPKITGFEGQSVQVFEVVDEQEPATALARITEYLVEMRDLDQAAAAAQGLRRFPADFGAWVARAEVDWARGDEAGFANSLKILQARLATKYPAVLPWDLRVGLAVVLARAKQDQLAREQVAVCLATADKEKLRGLSPGSLYRLLVLSRAFGNRVDPQLREFALTLVPTELRDRLQ